MAKVLIVDDAPDMRELIAASASGAGHEVVLARDGREAMFAVRAGPPDLIVLDLHMPVMSGLEVLRELSAMASQDNARMIPVVVLTADSDPRLRTLTRELGASRFFNKGNLSLDDLEQAIGTLTNGTPHC